MSGFRSDCSPLDIIVEREERELKISFRRDESWWGYLAAVRYSDGHLAYDGNEDPVLMDLLIAAWLEEQP